MADIDFVFHPIEMQGKCLEAGFAVYPSIGTAARAISRVVTYGENRGQQVSRADLPLTRF